MDAKLERLSGKKLYSPLDMHSGYFAICMKDEDIIKTTFAVEDLGFFAYRAMPFGLKGASSTFCKLIATVFQYAEQGDRGLDGQYSVLRQHRRRRASQAPSNLRSVPGAQAVTEPSQVVRAPHRRHGLVRILHLGERARASPTRRRSKPSSSGRRRRTLTKS